MFIVTESGIGESFSRLLRLSDDAASFFSFKILPFGMMETPFGRLCKFSYASSSNEPLLSSSGDSRLLFIYLSLSFCPLSNFFVEKMRNAIKNLQYTILIVYIPNHFENSNLNSKKNSKKKFKFFISNKLNETKFKMYVQIDMKHLLFFSKCYIIFMYTMRDSHGVF